VYLRWDHLGFNGYIRDTTPNLDELSRNSVVFDNAYSHAPWTHPSLASIHTGLHPKDVGINQFEHRLKESQVTLAEVLRENGYHTRAYVSHTIFEPRYGYNQGFDVYDLSVLEKGHPHNVSTSRELTDKVIDCLDKGDTPFFLWVHYFDPHWKYLNHEEFDFPRNKRVDRYDSEIAYTDFHIGRLLDELKRFDDTIIVVLADHGEEFLDHGEWGHTNTLYEELIHIPLIIYVPGFKHQRVREIVAESDIMPTILKLIEVETPSGLKGGELYFDRNGFNPRNRTVFSETQHSTNLTCIIEGEYKLIANHENGSMLLFNLRDDPYERRDLANLERERVLELGKKLQEFYGDEYQMPESLELSQETMEKLKDLGYLT